MQSGGVGAGWRQWSVSIADVPSIADTESSTVPTSSSLSARCHVAHDGQRRHVLCSSRPFYLHLQVCFIQLIDLLSKGQNQLHQFPRSSPL